MVEFYTQYVRVQFYIDGVVQR